MVMPQEATQAPNWASLIVEDIEETFFSVDTNWRFTYLNHHAASMFGRSKEALLGKVLWEAFPSLIGSKFEPVYRQTMAEGTPHRVEDFSTTTQSWYDVWAYPIPHGLIIYFQDITARKRVEAELLRQAERARVQAEVSHALAEVTHVGLTQLAEYAVACGYECTQSDRSRLHQFSCRCTTCGLLYRGRSRAA